MPAIAADQSLGILTVTPLSPASQLLHLFCGVSIILVWPRSPVGAGLPAIAVEWCSHIKYAKKRPGFSWSRAFSMLLVESVALEGQSHALAATDAQGGEAFLGIALDHFMQQGHQHSAA